MPRLRFFFRQALFALLRSPAVTMLTVATTGLALGVLASFGILLENLARAADELGKDVEISVYLQATLRGAEQEQLNGQITRWPEIAAVRSLSSKAALQAFRTAMGPDAVLLDGLPPDLLPPSLEVRLEPDRVWTSEGVRRLGEKLKVLPGVSDVRYGQEEFERLMTLLRASRLVAGLLGLVLCLATILIVSNTIRLTVYARENEIEILSLVGATDAFVRAPFLIEGAIQGFGGGMVALFALFGLSGALQGLQSGIALALPGFVLQVEPLKYSLVVLVFGTLLGLLGSLFAVRRVQRVWT